MFSLQNLWKKSLFMKTNKIIFKSDVAYREYTVGTSFIFGKCDMI